MNKPHWLTVEEMRSLPPEDFSAYPNHQPQDPLIKHGDHWYFWNELYLDLHGPYSTQDEAHAALEDYRSFLNNWAGD